MVESVYVYQKSTGTLFCVTRKHYEEYKESYELMEVVAPKPEPEPVEHIDLTPEPTEVPTEPKEEEIIEVLPEAEILVVKSRGRKAKTKE